MSLFCTISCRSESSKYKLGRIRPWCPWWLGRHVVTIPGTYAGFHASGKICGQNGPKFITPSIFCQTSKVMSGSFLAQCKLWNSKKNCKKNFFRYIKKWWKIAKFCVPLFRWPWKMTLWFFLLDLDILY